MKRAHKLLCDIEAEKLEQRGFKVEFERWILSCYRVDIFAKKKDKTVIVECGFCSRPTKIMKKLKEVATYVIHVPYVYNRAYTYPWQSEDSTCWIHVMVNMELVRKFVEDHPDLKPFLNEEGRGKRGFQTLVDMMLRKALEVK